MADINKQSTQPATKVIVPCVHIFDVFNHGEVECRICTKRFQLGWAVDRRAEDLSRLEHLNQGISPYYNIKSHLSS